MILGLFLAALSTGSTRAQEAAGAAESGRGFQRTQVIDLIKGWNAIFLEVQPSQPDPSELFRGTPIDIVAAYFPPQSRLQFVTDPGVPLFKQLGWGVWYAENRPDAFLKSLHAVHAQLAYLVHSEAAHRWSVTGSVVRQEVQWHSDAFNFIGFPVVDPGGPTFAEFFSGSGAHRHNRIYRLEDERWRRVTDPDAVAMRSGEAFWIFSDGASSYQGPLRAETVLERGLALGGGGQSVVLRNETNHPIAPRMEHISGGGAPVPLSIVVKAYGDPEEPIRSIPVPKPAAEWTQSFPDIEAGRAISVPFDVQADLLGSTPHSSLLKIVTDIGTEIWIPVFAARDTTDQP